MRYFPLERGPGPVSARGWVGGYRITSTFGLRNDPITGAPGRRHSGMDLGATTGTKMIAVDDGELVQSWDPSGGGWWSMLYCDNGEVWGYGHASAYVGAPTPTGGRRRVLAGQVIALVGSTGASTGAHLHIAKKLRVGGAYVDPWDDLYDAANNNRFYGTDPTPITPITPPLPIFNDPQEVDMQLWKRSDSPDVYAVGLAAKMGPDSKDTPMDFHGGVFRYKLVGPYEAVLVTGTRDWGAQIRTIDVGKEPELADWFENMALIYQA